MTERDGLDALARLAALIRRDVVTLCHRARTSHVASSLSIVDILAVLYRDELSDLSRPLSDSSRDVFVLSKGHAAAALYATLTATGHLDPAELVSFAADGSPLIGYANHAVQGVDVSTGSLGNGLGIGVGMALARRAQAGTGRTFVLLSDGECDEGSVWEAALLAGHLELDGLVAIVDYNGLQGLGPTNTVVRLEPFADKWRSFGWHTVELDGHDHRALRLALRSPRVGAPLCIVAQTVKGKGVSFMEDDLEWHYRPPTDDDLRRALAEVGG
jgi:transketolase